jgi:hypothetical protein
VTHVSQRYTLVVQVGLSQIAGRNCWECLGGILVKICSGRSQMEILVAKGHEAQKGMKAIGYIE